MHFSHIAARAFDRPLLLEPRRGMTILATLAQLIARSNVESRLDTPRPSRLAMDDAGDAPERFASLPFGLTHWERDKAFPQVGKVAVIEADGTMVNKNGSLGPSCGMTGYDSIRTQIMAALRDDEIDAMALLVETPGGEVAGCFDLADFIHEAQAVKPIWAIVDGMAASAGYALASSCTRITCSSVGLLGSIGVIVAHWNFAKMLADDGVDVSLIYSGKHKADGNPFEPLPAEVRAEIQAEIDSVWDLFATLVARGRGLTPAAVKALEAQTYLAPAALKLKLCDAVQSPSDALVELLESVS